MFSKFSVVAILAVVVLVQATTGDKCNVGKLQCCQSVQKSSSKATQKQLGLLNFALRLGDILVDLQCNPISISAAIGLGTGSNCIAQPVRCEDNRFNGVVAIGCTPINVNV